MKLSVIIPVRNGGEAFRQCLEALTSSSRPPDEIIVIDDASTDDTAQLASRLGVLVQSAGDTPRGPARCRNRGADIAGGDVLVFIDADVVVHADALAKIEGYLVAHPEISALFGSYDDDPPHRGLVSRYKNLQHHYVHQHSPREASTFWTGLGAVRREIFVRLGGFNESYGRPCIEDIELGVRLTTAGYRVWLCSDILATHLKEWDLASLIRTDIFDRAIPWTWLILSSAHLPSDLNLDHKSRLGVICSWVLIFHLVCGFWLPIAWAAVPVWLGLLIATNFSLYRFFYRKGGVWFALGAFCLHVLYLLYSSLAFTAVWLANLLRRGNTNPYTSIRLDELVGESQNE